MRINMVIMLFLISIQLFGQIIPNDIGLILDKIHLQSQKQEKIQESLGDYKYKQSIHFIKMDGDGEIEEQSKREYNIYVKSDSLRKRELISALQYEDEKWTDITNDEKNSSKEKHTESKSFSLSEMVGPENRQFYDFEVTEEEYINGFNTIHLLANAIEEDEDRFQGHLWFETNNYSLVKAELSPSEMPTFVDDMQMFFEMQNLDSLWFPEKIEFDAEVGILFLFSGKIHSEIHFSEFEFDQRFDDTWFNDLENAD